MWSIGHALLMPAVYIVSHSMNLQNYMPMLGGKNITMSRKGMCLPQKNLQCTWEADS